MVGESSVFWAGVSTGISATQRLHEGQASGEAGHALDPGWFGADLRIPGVPGRKVSWRLVVIRPSTVSNPPIRHLDGYRRPCRSPARAGHDPCRRPGLPRCY